MSRRYINVQQESVYDAFNRARDSFLAAKDGNEVDLVIEALLTSDEKIRIGRRIQVAKLLRQGKLFREIKNTLRVGLETIDQVDKKLSSNPEGFDIIFRRGDEVEDKYHEKAYRKEGGPRLLHKRTVYTGYKRKDVPR
ncbi:hypothetical protein COY33_02380 [candidate division WWE3 bacterium CG_4_10_14_0_2_um_filter_42_7]|uniref:Uncharacterized protein n=2 Tax=Katanobacteria TaxID=422282 RepID=A0A2H0X8Y3_UNCKA|nr:MAG: hypothetical protein COT51_03045 [candidate division WWE3 bacterium CG08_land_8_20_14_0_20_41_15]PIZ42904.1 MAG: hypothetical protein COY33_02380 [candidate division WWE3 bacterium CG_4_10_14_0_2_um_filter_42_7]